jgi:hypothetical protein
MAAIHRFQRRLTLAAVMVEDALAPQGLGLNGPLAGAVGFSHRPVVAGHGLAHAAGALVIARGVQLVSCAKRRRAGRPPSGRGGRGRHVSYQATA